MDLAIEQAHLAQVAGEVPVGAVVVHEGTVLSRAHNLVEMYRDATAHAELLALRAASALLGEWRLKECLLVATLEPCVMCTGALILSRVPTIVYGASDDRFGALGSFCDFSWQNPFGPLPRVIGGVKKEQCGRLLQDFFKGCR